MLKQLKDIFLSRDSGDQPAPSLDAMLHQMDDHIHNMDTLVMPAPQSKPRTSFDSGLPRKEVGLANLSIRDKLKVLPRAFPLFINMQLGARMYDNKHRTSKTHASPQFIETLESIAKASGAKDIAYVKVPNSAIFQGKAIPAPYAIVFTVEMDKEPLDTAPSFEAQLEVMDGYKRMAGISMKLAKYMHKQGFEAYPGTALGGLTDYTHLAELAGLGAIGYHGLLISRTEGARLRINTIYTSIENLPIKDPADNEHLWVRDFCSMCHKCVRKCPVSAIYNEPEPRGDGGMQSIDHATCRAYFAKNFGCGVCLAICPFSQVGYDKVQTHFKGNADAPQFRIDPIYINENGDVIQERIGV